MIAFGLLVVILVVASVVFLQAYDVRISRKGEIQRNALHQQAQRLESLGKITGGVTHDFQNILGVIQSYAFFAEEDLASGNREELTDDIVRIQTAAKSGIALTQKLLSFARRDRYEPKEIDLNAVVGSMHPLLSRIIESLVVRVDLDTSLPPILADQALIEQCLLNFVDNASDAGASEVVIATYRSQGRVALKVTDDGEGMTPDVRNHVFDPFFTTKARGQGTGIGLASVYGIVTQAGGQIEVHSEPGRGTVFCVFFPPAKKLLSGVASSV